jgi:hypothetical protein
VLGAFGFTNGELERKGVQRRDLHDRRHVLAVFVAPSARDRARTRLLLLVVFLAGM